MPLPPRKTTREPAAELRISLPRASLDRFNEMVRMSETTPEEVSAGAFRLYEEALKAEHAGGTAFLVVKQPDGSTTEQQIFKTEDEAA